MNCRDVRSLLARYVDGEADRYEQTLIEQHLVECQTCAEEVSQLRVTRQRVRRELKSWAASAVPPATAWDRLMAKLAAEKETPAQAVVPITHPDNPINNTFRRGMALSKRIVLAGLVMAVMAALLVLIFRNTQ